MSNGHVGLRGTSTRASRGLRGTHQLVLRDTPPAVRRSRIRLSGDGQSIVDVTNGKILRLLVDDEPFDVRYGDLEAHERVLDMRAGTLIRNVCWTSPAGKRVKVCSTRLVSLAQRGVAAIEYVVEAVGEFALVTVQSELVANEDQPQPSADPRVAAVLLNPLEAVQHDASQRGRCSCTGLRSSR